MQFHSSLTYWLPFYWRGFQSTVRYTYVLEDLRDLESVLEEFDSRTKWGVRKAQQQVQVNVEEGVGPFYSLILKTFDRQGLKPAYDEGLLESIYQACCKERDAGKIIMARDQQGRIHSGAFLVWDEDTVYYLLAGSDPAYRDSVANSLVVWEAIQLASRLGKKFDFEGSVVENIERFFRSFGATPVPYFRIEKTNSKWIAWADRIGRRLGLA